MPKTKGCTMRTACYGIALVVLAFGVACGGSSTPGDGGGPAQDGGRPNDGGSTAQININVTATPATGAIGTETTFTAAVSGGVVPYRSCTWTFDVTQPSQAGTVSGSSCTGKYTYNSDGQYAVSVDVTDSANHFGTGSLSYSVGGSSGGQPDLIVQSGSLQLVSPPPLTQYKPGDAITVQFVVQNVGNGDAAASTANISIKSRSSAAVTSLGDVPVPAIPMGGMTMTLTKMSNIPSNQPFGNYDLLVTVNSAGNITEGGGGTSNNTSLLESGISVAIRDGG
jgi:hypothetical protein